jgi:hypothetical protein
MADYEVKKGVLGHKVLYNCPACSSPLTSSLDKAGTNDACPDCNRPHVIPGSAEKTHFEQAATAKRQQKIDEEAKRRAAAKAVPKPIPKSVSNITPQPNHPPQPPNKQRELRRQRFGDGILDKAFVVARVSSVVVIIIGVIGLLIIAAQYGAAYSDYRSEQPSPLKVPSAAEYTTYTSQISDSPPEPTTNDNTPNTSARERSKTPDPLTVLFKKHKLVVDYLILNRIRKLAREFKSGEYEEFLQNLDSFLAAQKDKNKAAYWFCSECESNLTERERQIEVNKLHNEIRSGRMWSLTTVAGGLFGGLIGFMVLPLLIRIEANTRYADSSPTSST